MTRRTYAGVVAAMLCLAGSAPVSAQVSGVTNRAAVGGTTVDWGVLGPAGTLVPYGSVVGAGGVNLTLGINNGMMKSQDPCQAAKIWWGNFAPCDHVLFTVNGAPMSITFDQYVSGFGSQIQSAWYGNFAAQIEAFRDNVSLGTFAVNGVSNGNADNSAVFLGMVSGSAASDFNKVVLSLTSAPLSATGAPTTSYLAINQANMTVGEHPQATPEPITMSLLGTGLLGLAGMARRRRARAQA